MTDAARVEVRLGARRVTRAFGPVVANDRVDLAVAPATIHAVVGGNGAGKSTLMRILQGVDRPDEGSVILDDARFGSRARPTPIARGIGMVHQEFMLAPPLTLLENLILAREPLGRGGLIDWRAAQAEADRLAEDRRRRDRLAPARRGRAGACAAGARDPAAALSRRRRPDPRRADRRAGARAGRRSCSR